MKGRLGKFGTIFLAVTLALALTGAGFAHWSDTVQIEGTVHMGSATLAFDFVEPAVCDEYYRDPDTGALVPGEWLGKEVGDCDAWFDDLIEDVHSGKKGYKKLWIVVTNAYPQYIVHTTFKLHNIGTVPLVIMEYIITGEKRDSTGAVIYNLLWYDPDGNWIGELWEDVNGNGVVDTGGPDLKVINLEITDALPYQIDPCNTNKAEIDLDFKQDAEECHTYAIDVVINAIQWNKA